METVRIESTRFDPIDVPVADLIHFDGLPGFPEARRFAILEHDRASPFGWLACADVPELCFVVTDPRQFFPEYRPETEPELPTLLDADADTELDVLAIVCVREGVATLNLAAPLLVNPVTRRGVQAILQAGGHSAQAVLARPEAVRPQGPEDPPLEEHVEPGRGEIR